MSQCQGCKKETNKEAQPAGVSPRSGFSEGEELEHIIISLPLHLLRPNWQGHSFVNIEKPMGRWQDPPGAAVRLVHSQHVGVALLPWWEGSR